MMAPPCYQTRQIWPLRFARQHLYPTDCVNVNQECVPDVNGLMYRSIHRHPTDARWNYNKLEEQRS